MATIEPDEYRRIVAFLQALDGKARHKAILYVIGGAAVTLAYAPDNRTADVDVIDATEEVIRLGGEDSVLASEFGLHIQPLSEISFAAPAGWKERCQILDMNLQKLSIKIADSYDIILGKVARLEPRDVEDIEAMHAGQGFDPALLLDRLNNNLSEVKNSAGYRNNCRVLFEMLGRPIVFKRGRAEFTANEFRGHNT